MNDPLISLIFLTTGRIHLFRKVYQKIKEEAKEFSSEIIVIDNNSEDETRDFLKKDPPDIYLRFKKNVGIYKAFNAGFRISRGLYLFKLDDDILLPDGFIKEAIEILSADENLIHLGWNWRPEAEIIERKEIGGHLVDITKGATFGSSALTRKSLNRYGFFDEAFSPYGLGDSDWCLRPIADGKYNGYVADRKSFHLETIPGRELKDMKINKDEAILKNQALFDSRWKRKEFPPELAKFYSPWEKLDEP